MRLFFKVAFLYSIIWHSPWINKQAKSLFKNVCFNINNLNRLLTFENGVFLHGNIFLYLLTCIKFYSMKRILIIISSCILFTACKKNNDPQVNAAVTVAGGNGMGSASNQLNWPWGLFVDGSGNIYVADESNARVQKWAVGASSGTTVAGGNGLGIAANQLNTPAGVFVDGSGNIYVAEFGNHRIQKWAVGSTTGVTVAGSSNGVPGSAQNQLANPCGVYVDVSGNVYVADGGNNRIQKWAVGASSAVTVAGGNGAGSGANQLTNPSSIYLDADGNMFIDDQGNSRIQKWAAGAASGSTVAGNGTTGSLSSQFHYAYGFSIDKAGNIYVADAGNNRIQKWAPGATTGVTVAGSEVGTSGSDASLLNLPWGVFVDGNGKIYVSDHENNRIQKW